LIIRGCPIIDGNGKIGAFPGCTEELSNALNPLDLHFSINLEKAMALFWRVRTWEVQVQGTYTYLESLVVNYQGGFVTMTGYPTPYPPGPISKQEDIVCNPYGYGDFSAIVPAVGTQGGFTTDWPDPVTFAAYFGQFEPLKKYQSIFYPYGIIACGAGDNGSSAGNAGTYSVNFLNYTINGNLSCNPDLFSSSVSVQVRAKEYW